MSIMQDELEQYKKASVIRSEERERLLTELRSRVWDALEVYRVHRYHVSPDVITTLAAMHDWIDAALRDGTAGADSITRWLNLYLAMAAEQEHGEDNEEGK
jgi:hypothetical protein